MFYNLIAQSEGAQVAVRCNLQLCQRIISFHRVHISKAQVFMIYARVMKPLARSKSWLKESFLKHVGLRTS